MHINYDIKYCWNESIEELYGMDCMGLSNNGTFSFVSLDCVVGLKGIQ